MSIGKRLLDLAKANLTDFRLAFDRDHLREMLTREEAPPEPVASDDDRDKNGKDDKDAKDADDDKESVGSRAGRRARRFKDAAEEAWEKAYEQARHRAGVRGDPPSDPAADRRRWYKDLELEPGADLKTVRRSYRRLLLKYHPDKFQSDPAKLQMATEVTRKLTEAYNGLSRYLGA
jgi:DnaJ-domain-containing protein 1